MHFFLFSIYFKGSSAKLVKVKGQGSRLQGQGQSCEESFLPERLTGGATRGHCHMEESSDPYSYLAD